jgi:hypothetical protein
MLLHFWYCCYTLFNFVYTFFLTNRHKIVPISLIKRRKNSRLAGKKQKDFTNER